MKKYKTDKKNIDSVQECTVAYEKTMPAASAQADVLDSLTLSQQRSLHLALNQLNEGNSLTHSEVVEMSKQWLRM